MKKLIVETTHCDILDTKQRVKTADNESSHNGSAIYYLCNLGGAISTFELWHQC